MHSQESHQAKNGNLRDRKRAVLMGLLLNILNTTAILGLVHLTTEQFAALSSLIDSTIVAIFLYTQKPS